MNSKYSQNTCRDRKIRRRRRRKLCVWKILVARRADNRCFVRETKKSSFFFTTSSSRASNSNFTDKIQSERKYFLILKTDVWQMFAWKPGCALDIDSSRAFLVQQRGTLFSVTLIPFSRLLTLPRVFWPEFLGLMAPVFAILLSPSPLSRSNANIFTHAWN